MRLDYRMQSNQIDFDDREAKCKNRSVSMEVPARHDRAQCSFIAQTGPSLLSAMCEKMSEMLRDSTNTEYQKL